LAGVAAEFLAGKLGLSDKTVEAVQTAISGTSGNDLVKLKQIAADLQEHLASFNVQLAVEEVKAAASQVDSVNKTLQTEAMGGNSWQRNHHAYESSAVVLLVVGVYFVLPICKIAVPSIPVEAFIMLGGVLGVTAWQRGKANASIAAATGQQ
jgi:hypothetical protein